MEGAELSGIVVPEPRDWPRRSTHRLCGRGWVHVSLKKHTSSKSGCDLERIDAVVLRLASMNRFHVKSMTDNEVDTFARTEVGEPVPGNDALDGDDKIASERSDGFQKNVRVGGQVSMKENVSFWSSTHVYMLRA